MMRGEIAFETSEAADFADESTQPWTSSTPAADVARAGRILTGVCLLALLAGAVVPYQVTVFLLAAAGVAAVLAGISAPAVGLLGVGLLCTIDPAMRVAVFIPLGLPHNTLNYLLLVLALVTAPRMVQRLDLRMTLLAAFVAVLTLGVMRSPEVVLGTQASFEVLVSFAFIGLFMRADINEDVLTWLAIVTATAAIAALGVYYVFRPWGLFINPNALVHVALAALACIALAAAAAPPKRWLLMSLLVTLNTGLAFITASRGGFLVSIPLMLFVLVRTPGFRSKGYLLAVVAAAFLLMPLLWTTQFSRTTAKWGRFVDPALSIEQSTSRRASIAWYGWDTFRENPLGVGTGGFRDTRPGIALRPDEGLAAHSGWIKTMAENGVPGLLLLSTFVLAFACARPRSREVAGSLGPLVAVTITVLLVTTEFQSKALWLLVGGAIVLLQGSIPPGTPAVTRARGDDLRSSVINRQQRIRTP